MAQSVLDKHSIKVLPKEVSGFEAYYCVAGIDAERHMAVRVILKYATNVEGESGAVLLKEVRDRRVSK